MQWPCPATCKAWLSELFLSNTILLEWPCRAVCKGWLWVGSSRVQPKLWSRNLAQQLAEFNLGRNSNQSLDAVTLPSNLQSLTFRAFSVKHNLVGVTLPSSLQRLSLGGEFKSSTKALMQWPCPATCKAWLSELFLSNTILLEWPCRAVCKGWLWVGSSRVQPKLWSRNLAQQLAEFNLGRNSSQSLDAVTLPSNLQSLTFRAFSVKHNLVGVTLPSSLQRLTLGGEFKSSTKTLIA